MLSLTRRLLALRRAHPVLRQRAFFEGRPVTGGDGCKDLAWFHPDGHELAAADWFDTGLRSLAMYLDGRGLRHRNNRGETIMDDSFVLLLHSDDTDRVFALPDQPWAAAYEWVIDSTQVGGLPVAAPALAAGAALPMRARSVVLLRVLRG
jgi:glycogen operon protein